MIFRKLFRKGIKYITKMGVMYFQGKLNARIDTLLHNKCSNCGVEFFDDNIYKFTASRHEKYGMPPFYLCTKCAGTGEVAQ